MSNYAPHEDEALGGVTVPIERIEAAIAQNTNDFNELTEILGLDPKTDFAEGNLSQFDLQNADLAEANLNDSRLDQANLQNADLKGANLKGANLSNCDLTEADLRGANLTNASFKNAILQGTKFDENSQVKNANFTHAEGLTPEIIEKLKQSQAYIDANAVITDHQLKTLVDTFCQETKGTKQWNKAFYQLLWVVHNLPQLTRNYQPSSCYSQSDFEKQLYQRLSRIIREAICQEFDSDESNYIYHFTEWISYQLRFTDQPNETLKEISQSKTFSLEEYPQECIKNYEDGETLTSIDELIAKAQAER